MMMRSITHSIVSREIQLLYTLQSLLPLVFEMDKLTVSLPTKEFPPEYTCDGMDRSPPLKIEGLSRDVKAVAVIMVDASAPGGGTFTHWLIWNMEPVRVLPEAIPKDPVITFPLHAVQGTNDYGRIGYSGPCPGPGPHHRYIFKVYALREELDLEAGATKAEVASALSGRVIQFGSAEAIYSR